MRKHTALNFLLYLFRATGADGLLNAIIGAGRLGNGGKITVRVSESDNRFLSVFRAAFRAFNVSGIAVGRTGCRLFHYRNKGMRNFYFGLSNDISAIYATLMGAVTGLRAGSLLCRNRFIFVACFYHGFTHDKVAINAFFVSGITVRGAGGFFCLDGDHNVSARYRLLTVYLSAHGTFFVRGIAVLRASGRFTLHCNRLMSGFYNVSSLRHTTNATFFIFGVAVHSAGCLFAGFAYYIVACCDNAFTYLLAALSTFIVNRISVFRATGFL